MQSEPTWLDQPVTDTASAHSEALPERAHLRFILVQARTEDDPARGHERACFAARLGVSPDQLDCVSIFADTLSEIDLSGVHGVLVGGAGQYSVLDDLGPVRDFVAYTAWHATPTAGDVKVGTDTFAIRDGKIAVQTFAMYLEPEVPL